MEKRTNKKIAGITLIALVLTIIVMLILAGITINLSIGEDGIIKRAQDAGGEYTNAAISEREQLTNLTNRTDEIITNVTGFNKEKEKIIQIQLKGEKEQTTVPVNLSFEVKRDEEKITNYKWVLNSEKEEIGIEEEKYTEEVVNEENTELKISEAGTYYLHVLTAEDNGVKKETVKGPISVSISYHEHVGSSSTKGDCYNLAIYHSHVSSCYGPCSGTKKALYEDDNGFHWHKCTKCGYKDCHTRDEDGEPCERTVTKCGKSNTITGYKLGCGKTEETIESVTVEY